MEPKLKKQLRLLGERYLHQINYHKDEILLNGTLGEVKISQKNPNTFTIHFKSSERQVKSVDCQINDLFDIIIELLRRDNFIENITPNDGILLTLDEWTNEEGNSALIQLKQLKSDLIKEDIEYRNLGGNRYLAEYYNGLLILTDDLSWAKSNVIPIKEQY